MAKRVKTVQKGSMAVELTAWRKSFQKYWQLYILMVPVVAAFILFKYIPMLGIQIAFKDYSMSQGIWKSQWIGLYHFIRFFSSYKFVQILLNTLILSVASLAITFPLPILFSLVLNEIRLKHLKSAIQTISFAPHFISTVVVVGMLTSFLAPSSGIVNVMLMKTGVIHEGIYFTRLAEWFRPLYILTTVWTDTGWNAIIYISAMASIGTELYEAAQMDGASRFKQMLHITLPGIKSVVIILLILNCGHILGVGYEKVLLMQTSTNLSVSEVISTYVYSRGISSGQYDYATAIGLFNSIINFIMLVIVNKISKKFSEVSLW